MLHTIMSCRGRSKSPKRRSKSPTRSRSRSRSPVVVPLGIQLIIVNDVIKVIQELAVKEKDRLTGTREGFHMSYKNMAKYIMIPLRRCLINESDRMALLHNFTNLYWVMHCTEENGLEAPQWFRDKYPCSESLSLNSWYRDHYVYDQEDEEEELDKLLTKLFIKENPKTMSEVDQVIEKMFDLCLDTNS